MAVSLQVILASCVLALAGLSGCYGIGGSDDSGSGGSGDGNSTSGGGLHGNVTVGGNGTGNTTVGANATYSNGTMSNGTSNQTAPHTEYRNGTVSGIALLTSQPSSEESFTVRNGTTNIALTLNVTGDELVLHLRPPGCTDSSCEQTTTTSGGTASATVSNPPEGEYDLILTPTSGAAGPVDSDYSLAITWS